jgi:fructose-bisphosphate aldolase, class I
MATKANADQLQKAKSGKGFIAALDQSGGSTPKALKLYGVEESEYKNDAEMFDLIHAMRSRIISSPVFTSERILGAILFEILPFLKVDNGLADDANDAQIMKPIPELSTRLESAKSHGVFGTKMRSVIKLANKTGISDVVKQQFEIGKEIVDAGLVPIIEPEVDIKSPEKSAAEVILKAEILGQLNSLNGDQNVMLKLTLPNETGFFGELVKHPRVIRVVALSGGYSREEANKQLAKNPGVIASFSRALTEGLSAKQTESQFNGALDAAIQSIFEASNK